jgi:hypothetical protein
MNNMKFNKKNIFFIIINSIIIHLGKNPKNGGNPPNDKSVINREIFIIKFELNKKNVCLIFKSLKLLKIKTILIFKKE